MISPIWPLRRGWPSGLQFPEAPKAGEEAAGGLCQARLAVFSAVVAVTIRETGDAGSEMPGPEASESTVEENEDDNQFVSKVKTDTESSDSNKNYCGLSKSKELDFKYAEQPIIEEKPSSSSKEKNG
ncbi:hypothetical protein MJG53_017139 [Ovis ammon polii x Ovis aries]|uniref:Uncharacterized protein n=1 Tax=Ovis ammon polii x Ovis aries TaxID=2918886 RepID=A0ACB9U6Z3_9CETA|nr:hypothetical protein MJG53_017139 [Ovis ammon polii x Ovis aries]